eukprot:scaffold135838_cov36-Tisochrysis_lutea.AAC.2
MPALRTRNGSSPPPPSSRMRSHNERVQLLPIRIEPRCHHPICINGATPSTPSHRQSSSRILEATQFGSGIGQSSNSLTSSGIPSGEPFIAGETQR